LGQKRDRDFTIHNRAGMLAVRMESVPIAWPRWLNGQIERVGTPTMSHEAKVMHHFNVLASAVIADLRRG
jgi:hypothetical protein